MGTASSITYEVVTYDRGGNQIRQFTADVRPEDGAEFIAHHALHVDNVAAVEVIDPETGSAVLQAADPGLTFAQVVGR